MLKKLITKFNAKSLYHLSIIFLIFSLSGSGSLLIASPIFTALNLKELINFYPVDKYSDENLGNQVSLSLRFILQSDDKTLEEEDITSSMDAILNALDKELGIGLR